MRISIVIPYYNRKDLLLNTLRSLARQSLPASDYEVILVDDGSEDLVRSDLVEFDSSLLIRLFRYERTTESSPALARNRGLKECAGDIVLFLDCDQVFQHDFLEAHLSFFREDENENNFIQFGIRKMLEQPVTDVSPELVAKLPYKRDIRFALFETKGYNVQNLETSWYCIFSHNISAKRAVFERVGGFDPLFMGWGLEDIELGYRLAKAGVKILFNPGIEVYHQHHPRVYDKNRFGEWYSNVKYFMNKTSLPEVGLQEIFCDVFDPERRDRLTKTLGLNGEQLYSVCLDKFERSVRVVNDVEDPVAILPKYIVNPTLTEIEALMRTSVKWDLHVILTRPNGNLVRDLQYQEAFSDVHLFLAY